MWNTDFKCKVDASPNDPCFLYLPIDSVFLPFYFSDSVEEGGHNAPAASPQPPPQPLQGSEDNQRVEENLPQLDGIVDEDDLEDDMDGAEEDPKKVEIVLDTAAEDDEPAGSVDPETTAMLPTEPSESSAEPEESAAITDDSPATVDAVSVAWMSAEEAANSAPIFTLNAVDIVNIEGGGAGLEIVPVAEDVEGEEAAGVVVLSEPPAEGQVVIDSAGGGGGGDDILGRIMNESEIGGVTDDVGQGK